MTEVYEIYKKKNLIDKSFPEYTLVELIEKVKSLDRDLAKLFGQADLSATSDRLDYKNVLKNIKNLLVVKMVGWKDNLAKDFACKVNIKTS